MDVADGVADYANVTVDLMQQSGLIGRGGLWVDMGMAQRAGRASGIGGYRGKNFLSACTAEAAYAVL